VQRYQEIEKLGGWEIALPNFPHAQFLTFWFFSATLAFSVVS